MTIRDQEGRTYSAASPKRSLKFLSSTPILPRATGERAGHAAETPTMPQTALLCTNHLFRWAGSELVSCELAEALVERGLKVKVLCNALSDLVGAPLAERGVDVTDRLDEVALAEFDLVYCQHQVISLLMPDAIDAWLETGERLPVFVYNHLSPFEVFETPGPFVEQAVADIILCNSEETRAQLALYGPPFDTVRVFANPAPDEFVRAKAAPGARLAKLLAVSNHLPEELSQALTLLERSGVVVTRIGRKHAHRRLTAVDIAAHDAVVSIGKTVQYALAGKTAVFCYDKFAGPGWIGAANLAAAAQTNFSGRPETRPRTPEQLEQELTSGFSAAAQFAAGLSREQLSPFLLSPQLDALLADVDRAANDDARRAEKLSNLKQLRDSGQAAREERLYRLVRREFLGRHKNELAKRRRKPGKAIKRFFGLGRRP